MILQNRIETTFGKKGSGKTNLLFQQMARQGGKIVYFSPVMPPPFHYHEVWSLNEIENLIAYQKPGQIIYVTNVSLDAFDLVCCYATKYQDLSLFIDEANHYTGSTEISDLVDYGRHNRINIFGNTRRYTEIPRKLTANSDFINIFRTIEPRDLQYLREFCGKEVLEPIQSLPPYHYIRYDTDKQFFETIHEKLLTP